jgi:Flp pilus assembly pilin Flp
MLQLFTRFKVWHDDEGVTALEYGVLVSGIIVALLVGVGLFGTAVSDWFKGLFTSLGMKP